MNLPLEPSPVDPHPRCPQSPPPILRLCSLGQHVGRGERPGVPQQAEGVLDLVEERWDELVGHMPLKIVYPALEKEEWRIITGADPKNT